MTNLRRTCGVLARVAWAVVALLCPGVAAAAAAQAPAPGAVEPQIHWQRSVEDAIALAAREKRPILVAINVDGESGSDRIVREEYRDPRFVAATRSFVCLIASVSRHNPRDFDDRGQRIPCPRLGEITCGEHIALEPLVFDRWLGGERISPRHALILPDGTKAFDVSLVFDIGEMDARVQDAARAAPPPVAPTIVGDVRGSATERRTLWREAARARTARGRARCEVLAGGQTTEQGALEILDAVAEMGNEGSLGVLRVLAANLAVATPRVRARVADVAATLEIGPALARAAHQRFTQANPCPGAIGLGEDREWLPWTSRFEPRVPATRAYLLARSVVGLEADRRAAEQALAPLLQAADVSRVAAAVEAEGGGLRLQDLLVFAHDVGRALPRGENPPEPALDPAEIDRKLIEAERALSARPDDAEAMMAFGLASLDVARHALDTKTGQPQLNLADAEQWLERAARARPSDARLGFARARTAYLLGKYQDEESIARATFGGYPPRDAISPRLAGVVDVERLPDGDVRRAATLIDDHDRIEALRWYGDAAARLLPARAGGDPAEEAAGYLRGARALALVAVSPGSGEIDWISLASFLSALELEREELAVWQAGAERLPDSAALREGLNRALWLAGRIDLAPVKADWLASLRPGAPADAWFAGYAWLLWAEDQRRAHAFDAAIAAYAASRARFETYARLAPERAGDVSVYLGMTQLGEGHAHTAQGRRQSAADALVRGVAASRAVLRARDGLDRDVPDLVDEILEWRAGRKSPVEPRVLAESLRRAAPDAPELVVAVSDSELREALRADGRSPRTRTTPEGTIERVPDVEGDEYMAAAIDVARMAVPPAGAPAGDAADAARRNLAQMLTVQAERQLARADTSAFARLVEAAAILGQEAPTTDELTSLRASAARLRAILGEARPMFRPGR